MAAAGRRRPSCSPRWRPTARHSTSRSSTSRARTIPEFDLDERARKLGVESFYTIDERYKFDIGALRQLLQLLREKQIDVFHAHCYKSDLYGLILRRYHKMKLVTTAHGPLASFQFFWASKNWRVRYLYDQIDLRILRYFDVVIMVSDTMRGIISRYGVDPAKMIWVRNAIDSNYFRRTGRARRAFRASSRHSRRARSSSAPSAGSTARRTTRTSSARRSCCCSSGPTCTSSSPARASWSRSFDRLAADWASPSA